MKNSPLQYFKSMSPKNKKILTYSALAVVVLTLLSLAWCLVGRWNEQRALDRYLANPETKQFAEWIIRDKNELAGSLEKVKQIAPTMDIGLQWYNLREYGYAVKWWGKGLDIEPKNTIGWYNLGNAHTELGNYWRAERAYRRSIEHAKKGDVEGCLGLGELYQYKYKEKASEEPKVYLNCLKKSPKDPDLLSRLALYYKGIGDKENALKYFDELYTVYPTIDIGEELRALRM